MLSYSIAIVKTASSFLYLGDEQADDVIDISLSMFNAKTSSERRQQCG